MYTVKMVKGRTSLWPYHSIKLCRCYHVTCYIFLNNAHIPAKSLSLGIDAGLYLLLEGTFPVKWTCPSISSLQSNFHGGGAHVAMKEEHAIRVLIKASKMQESA